MTTYKILQELDEYLKPIQVSELRLTTSVAGCISMCMTIADIIKSYNDTPEREQRVSTLLSLLCRNHFKKQQVKEKA